MGVMLDVGSFAWSPSTDDVMLVKTLGAHKVTVIRVDDDALSSEDEPYEIIKSSPGERIVIVSRTYLQYISDDTDNPIRGAITIGTFLGSVTETAMQEIKAKGK